MSRNTWIGIVILIVLAAVAWWYVGQSNTPAISETTQTSTQQTTEIATQQPVQQNAKTSQTNSTNPKTFQAVDGTAFTLGMGQIATDGPGGVTIKLKSVTGGQYPSTIVNVIDASSTMEAGLAETAKTWGLTQDEYGPGAGIGSYLSWSAKWGDEEWYDTNSSTGIVKLKVTAIDPTAQTVTFMVSTTPTPPDNG
ncbi:MAG TPA: hypothetical protein VMH91_01760 [Candidatus Paceibacterota bacterium]|nr:hypothetical protein [Candidatus Paceibacterota bacterium]